jgi:hypothetical protein
MKSLFFILAAILLLAGCNFSKSVKVDLLSGLTTNGDLMSCDNVFTSVGGKKVNRNSFAYGEQFFLNFSDMKGMKSENDKVFPDMDMFVLDKSGDTVIKATDLYSQIPDGIKSSPVDIAAKLIAANPIHSGKDYTLYVKIRDKKDKGTFNAKLDFKVTPNQKLNVEANKISCNEIYLFSKINGMAITNNKVSASDKIYLIFDGVSGFSEADGKVYPGMSMKATGKDGAVVVSNDDLFADTSGSGLSAADLKTQVTASLAFTAGAVKNPVHVTVTLWDKKSDASVKVSTDIEILQ